jgi:CubicO group peptidase (beta-lactamase class C family)
MYREARVMDPDRDLAGLVTALSKLPLRSEPGSRWRYSVAYDVLGRLVEVASGMPFDEFLARRMFAPLGMESTWFVVPPAERHRMAVLYAPVRGAALPREAGAAPRRLVEPAVGAEPTENFPLRSGGGGLWSTAGDYLRFCQLILDGGALGGVRLVSRKTIELMATDQVGDLPGLSRPGYGFGLGFAVARDLGRTGQAGSVGELNWGGGAGTRFWIDPVEQLIGVFLVQIRPHEGLGYATEFRQLVYAAIAD